MKFWDTVIKLDDTLVLRPYNFVRRSIRPEAELQWSENKVGVILAGAYIAVMLVLITLSF